MFALPRLTKLVKYLIIANVVLWVLEVIILRTSFKTVIMNLFLTPNIFLDGYIWQIVTYMFFHSPEQFFHIILNMLILWMFSESLQEKWGNKKFLLFYLLSGITGGLFVVIEGFIIPEHFYLPTLGSSAVMFALTTAFALTFAETQIMFFFFPMKAKYLIHIDLGIILLSYLSIKDSNISEAAHLGGMFCAFILIKVPWHKIIKIKKQKKPYLIRVK